MQWSGARDEGEGACAADHEGEREHQGINHRSYSNIMKGCGLKFFGNCSCQHLINIKENMDHVWRNLEYIEETYEQMFLKTHRIQV